MPIGGLLVGAAARALAKKKIGGTLGKILRHGLPTVGGGIALDRVISRRRPLPTDGGFFDRKKTGIFVGKRVGDDDARRYRKTNYCNGRALSRAIRRLEGASKQYARLLTATKGMKCGGLTVKPRTGRGKKKC